MKRATFTLLPALVLLAGCWHGYAEVNPPAGPLPAADPPSRVARLSYTEGPVSLRAAGADAWTAAELNRPLTAGDELWNDGGARAELDLGHAFVRLDALTGIELLNLDDRGVQISLLQGKAQVRLRSLDEEDQFEIATPQAAVTLLRSGDYRFEAAGDGAETSLIVRAGQVEVTAPDRAFSVRALQQAQLTGTGTVDYRISAAPPLDSFDAFCATRDKQGAAAASLQYVSPSVIGWEDLDTYGTWTVSVGHGPIWRPRMVAAGWAPYRFGHWAWIEPWGWTWIDAAPWGFAPFHYGRWVWYSGYWGWVPGPPRVRAVYAPALVVFAGGGPGLHYYFRVGGGPGVAWFPLGPREIYMPPYRASRTYITNVNISHTVIANTTTIWRTDVTRQHYANRTIAGAVTAVPAAVFADGRAVSRSAVRVTTQEAREAHIGGMAPPVTPSRRSIAPIADGAPPAARPPAAVASRQTVVRRTPAPAPVPFDRQRPALEADPGRPPDPDRIQEMRRSEPSAAPRTRQVRPGGTTAAPGTAPSPSPAPPSATGSRNAGPPQAQQAEARQASPPAAQVERAQTRDTRAADDRRRAIERERQTTQAPPRGQPQRQPSRSQPRQGQSRGRGR